MAIDVIVVLGAALTPDGEATPALRRRVAHGVRLYHEGAAGVLLLSGGPTRHPLPEAMAMRTLALDGGVPEGCIVVEDKSVRTLHNASYTARIMRQRGWRRALVVTDSFHMPRALLTFRGFGVAVTAATVPGVWRRHPIKALGAAAREAVALIWYIWLIVRERAVARDSG
jgi:uncharacterized SAM-binding protein YcdF (DUF218 family)